MYPHAFYNQVYNVLDLVIDVINPEMNKQLVIHITNDLSEWIFLDGDDFKSFEIDTLASLVLNLLPKISNEVKQASMQLSQNQISLDQFLQYCQQFNIFFSI